jgi:2-polyprenyl-3-methyl-5-hydroxy-6-metoxy-1,4-benzoquinol methylase
MFDTLRRSIDRDFWTVRSVPGSPSWPFYRGRFLSRYRFAFRFAKGQRVLDVASGAGFGSHLLATEGGALEVVGVDVDEKAVAHARRSYPAPNLSFQVGDSQDLRGLAPSSFGLVTSMGTLEHIAQPNRFAQEVRRVLAPRGVWLVTMLNPAAHDGIDRFHHQEWDVERFDLFVARHFADRELLWHVLVDRGHAKREANTRRYAGLPVWFKSGVKRVIGARATYAVARAGAQFNEPEDYEWTPVPHSDALEFLAVCRK